MKLTNLMSELVKRNGSDLHLTGDSIPFFRVQGQILPANSEIYASEDGDDVLIPEDSKRELFQSLSEFASQCRLDLGISDRDVEEKLVQDAVETLTNTGKKGRDYSKKSFNGIMFAKNRYVWEVLSNHVNENPNITIFFCEIFPNFLFNCFVDSFGCTCF